LLQASIPTDAGKGATSQSTPPAHEELVAAFPQLEILELIGQGGMGFVFKARQPKIERLVALKILPQSLAADPAFAERFTREGRVLARLNHPNIVTIHDFGQSNGFFYLLMEFVDGVNLRQAMKLGRFTPAQALAVVPHICEALQFAHNEGILHRDIKPENILLDSKGRVKIADFGIAKLVGDPHTDATLTGSGATLGTPHYMAPEQLERPGEVDHRADIFSLGVVFYEMLTGELPLGKFQPPSQKVQVDVRLDEVVLHALEKEPARRYQQVSQVRTAVDTISGSAAPTVRIASPSVVAAPTQRPDRFWRRVVVVVLALIGSMAVLVPVRYLTAGKARYQAPNVQEQIASPPSQTASGQLVISAMSSEVSHPQSGRLNWGFKCFIPPDHLASILFIRWTNGVPTVDPGFSAYFKVPKTGGIDLPFCSVSCYPIPETTIASMTNAESRRLLSQWGISEPRPTGVTNVVQWNVNLWLGGTGSRWFAMPSYHQSEFKLPQRVRSGHQRAIRLVEFDGPEGDGNHGQSGVELRFFLEPLRSPPIRTAANEIDKTTYIAGTGLAGTLEEALNSMKNLPMDP
jgi:serine/threonine protein kinase